MTWIGIAAVFAFLGIGASGLSGSEPQGELVRYPTFGVALSQPKGWAEQMRDKGKTVVRWISPDSVPEKPAAMIMVECGQTTSHSLDELARGLAQNFHGVVADRPTTLGGTRALRVVAKNDGRTLRPVEGLATIHDGFVYLVIGGVTAGHSVADELEAIRASWTWMPIEPPHKHLEFRETPLSLFGGAATINIPALMHTYPTEHPDRILDLGLRNVLRNAPDFSAYVQLVPIVGGQELDALKNKLSQGLQAQYKIKVPIEWRAAGNNPNFVVSEAFEGVMPDKESGRKQTFLTRWALVKLDDRRLISINFTLPQAAPGSSSFVAVVDRIVESIRPGRGGDLVKEKETPGRPG